MFPKRPFRGSGNHLGQILLARLSPGQIDRGEDIFHPNLPGIKTNPKDVFLGLIGYFQDTPESDDGGAHGVGAAASHKPALLYQARHPEFYARDIHGKSSVYPVYPAFCLRPAGLAPCPARWLILPQAAERATKYASAILPAHCALVQRQNVRTDNGRPPKRL